MLQLYGLEIFELTGIRERLVSLSKWSIYAYIYLFIWAVNRVSYTLKTEQDENLFSKVARQMTKTVRKLKNKQGSEGKTFFKKTLCILQLEMEEENLVKKKALAKEKSDEVRVPLQVMRESIKLAMEMAGQNTTGFDKKTLKLVSPRFMSIMPEQEENSLVRCEVTKIETFEQLDRSYNKEQGYSFLTREQLEIVYGDGSPYNMSNVLRNFKDMRLKDDPHHMIEHDIRALAEAEKFKMRRHDIVKSPFVLTPLTYAGKALSQPIILSPLVLSPITLSPAVLGPIVLSPWVFIPLILSPRVLSPLILSPLVFSPIILSPLVLHPLILVPGVFNPFILSPMVLSPLILSPQVFSPLILSPFVLNPLILTPMFGSPLVLSPFVLSPIILSPQALFAVVLSPYALSPLVESKLISSEIILSPSWLS
uniref:Uncharacterized protein n=1 Tax=Heterorhabditis bacteriophora TaxID=37862 RepID=A0A1I7X5N6_HETBA